MTPSTRRGLEQKGAADGQDPDTRRQHVGLPGGTAPVGATGSSTDRVASVDEPAVPVTGVCATSHTMNVQGPSENT